MRLHNIENRKQQLTLSAGIERGGDCHHVVDALGQAGFAVKAGAQQLAGFLHRNTLETGVATGNPGAITSIHSGDDVVVQDHLCRAGRNQYHGAERKKREDDRLHV
jgi:hypothetical protein